MAKQTAKFIRLARSGVKACGPYEAGKEYEVGKDVTPEEAKRLVEVKGFEYVGKAPATTDEEQTQGGE